MNISFSLLHLSFFCINIGEVKINFNYKREKNVTFFNDFKKVNATNFSMRKMLEIILNTFTSIKLFFLYAINYSAIK